MKRKLKRFGFDIAGYFLLIAAPFVGLLPGPGGLPLIIAGLSLLSVHNAWARRLLIYVRNKTSNLREVFFPKNKTVELFWDIAAAFIFTAAFLVNYHAGVRILDILSISMGIGAIIIVLFNRSRVDRLLRRKA